MPGPPVPEPLPGASEGDPRNAAILDYLLQLRPEDRPAAIAQLGPEERETFDRAWPLWGHDGQAAPAACADGSDWHTWVIMAGRGFGKTLAGAKWIVSEIARGAPIRIALVGATLHEARGVMVEGPTGLLEVAGAWVSDWQPSLHRLKFRTGAEAALFSGASPERLRGPEHHLAWCDELAKWEKPGDTWDMLQFGLRLGENPRALVTTTPRPGPHLRRIMASPGCVVTGGPTSANFHVAERWQQNIHARYAGTRLGRQELEGELLTDTPGALWTVELLERSRRVGTSPRVETRLRYSAHPEEPVSLSNRRLEGQPSSSPGPNGGGVTSPGSHFGSAAITLVRVLIAIDPPSGAGTCGIIACARDSEGRAHILADHSVTGRSPEGWARAVADAARIWSYPERGGGPAVASAKAGGGGPVSVQIVAESNQGGKMVEAVLRTADPTLRVKLVTATVGKSERAAPVAMLFEAGKVLLHGRFPELEAELMGMIAGGGYEGPGISPDRADAMVWGLTELLLQKERQEPRIRTF